MPAKRTTTHSKVAAALFTTVVAPVLVHVFTAGVPESGARPASASTDARRPSPEPSSPAARLAPPTPHPIQPARITKVVIQGSGRSPEEAARNALHSALRHAVAAEVDTATWVSREAALMEALRRDGAGVLRGWRELQVKKDRKLLSPTYHSEVEVELDRRALSELVRAAATR